jgi:hypothetical protein
MSKVIAHPAPKPLTKGAPTLGRVAAVVLVIMLVLQLIGIGNMMTGLSAQFYDSDSWAIAVIIVALLIEIAAIPFLLRAKLSRLAAVLSGVAAILAPTIWMLVVLWSLIGSWAEVHFGTEISVTAAASQFGIAACFNVAWWLLLANIAWLAFNFYTVKQLNIEKVWYEATGLKPRTEWKKENKSGGKARNKSKK